jgi:aspartyl-tRNA(Asn)/glutamyl-tRNA(Gln) amidotransferase subunit C
MPIMKITEKDVQYIASLSRIHLKPEEVASLQKDLEGILEYVAKLDKLDVKNISPTSHVLPVKNVFREDVVKPSLKPTETMQFAVEHHEGSYKVPKVIE